MNREKEPLSYRLGDLGFAFPRTEPTQEQGGTRDKSNGRRRRRPSHGGRHMSDEHQTQGIPQKDGKKNLTPAGGKDESSSALDSVLAVAKGAGTIVVDDIGHPFMRGAATAGGAVLGGLGAFALGTKVFGLPNPFGG